METETGLNTLVGITWFVMFGLFMAVTTMYLKHKKKILAKEKEKQIASFKASVDAEERQKKRIANNLHDEVIPLISAIVQNTDANIRDLSQGKLSLENLSKDKEIALELVDSIRAIALELIPKSLLELGFIKAFSTYLKKMDSDSCIIEFQNKTSFETELPCHKSTEVNIYRVCLEIIQNLKKHDEFTYLKTELSQKLGNLYITFTHDGKGITNQEIEAHTQTSTGLGLKSLQARLLLLNATIDYLVDNDSSKIILTIPLNHE